VLVEKPITRALTDAYAVCRTADAKNVSLMTVSNKRYSPPYRRAKKFIVEGPVANPAMFVGKFNLGYRYVDLFESGTIHLFDLTRYLMGDATTVRCVGVNKYGRNRRRFPVDNAVVTFEFTSGAVGTLYTSSSALSLQLWPVSDRARGAGGGLRRPRLARRGRPIPADPLRQRGGAGQVVLWPVSDRATACPTRCSSTRSSGASWG
jgi:predicted dehydrogenase